MDTSADVLFLIVVIVVALVLNVVLGLIFARDRSMKR